MRDYLMNALARGSSQAAAAEQDAQQAGMQQLQNPLFELGQYLNTMSESDYNKEKRKYSKFKVCENPIKESEYTYKNK